MNKQVLILNITRMGDLVQMGTLLARLQEEWPGAAVDLGASSGRVMLGHVGHNELRLRPVARFPNNPVRTIDGLATDVPAYARALVQAIDVDRFTPRMFTE